MKLETKEDERPTAGTVCTRTATHAAIVPLSRVRVSEPFWREVFLAFPELETDSSHRVLFWYILFGGRHDEDTHRLLLCADMLSSIEGRDAQNTRAEAFLESFRREILKPHGADIQWTGWFHKKCRQLRRLNLGTFQETWSKELRGEWDLDGLVYLDGTRCSPRKQRHLRLTQQAHANCLLTHCEDAKNIRAYLNSLPSNLFAGLLNRNFQSARNLAFEIKNQNVRESQLRILRHIQSQPQPFYFPSARGHTVRLCTSEGIPNLKSEVRRALTRGWHDADLRSSQLAICGHLWAINEITDFLESGQSVWTHLCESISMPCAVRTIAKPILKKAIYSICYGMDEGSVKGLAARRFVIEEISKDYAWRLMSVPMVQTLLAARRKRLHEVEQKGGAMDCYDQWRPMTTDRHPRAILAEISQSWEMRLIAPAFELARTTNEFTIGLFQHDGFSVRFNKQTEVQRVERWKEHIEGAVNAICNKLQIPTGIEWTMNATNTHLSDPSRDVDPSMSPHRGYYSEKLITNFHKHSRR